MRPRVLLADDHRMVTEGLKAILADEFDLVGVVEDGLEMLAAAEKLRPDVIVADITMPHLTGIEALVRLKSDHPNVKVVILTMHQDAAYAMRALEAGAAGFVIKHSASTELILAIRSALSGKTFVAPALAMDVLQRRQARPNGESGKALTPRQLEILGYLAQGRSAKEIANILSISTRTVEFHKYQIMETHNLQSSAELIRFAIKQGVVTI
jgi:DNA-binding NarL/FixJ family response regulator